METKDIFFEAANNLTNSRIDEWRAAGGKVIGTYYSYLPEEIFTAAGLMTYRIRATGENGTERSDSFYTPVNCSYVRYQLNLAIKGKYDFLDGVVGCNMCDHVRRTYDNWNRAVDPEGKWYHFVTIPQKQGPAQTEYYKKNLNKLVAALEKEFKIEITDQKLRDAIILHNEIRTLQRRLHDLRKNQVIKLSGKEALAAMIAGVSMPKTVYKELLKTFIEELEQREGYKPGKRLLVTGCDYDCLDLYELLESQGAAIVADLTWYGARNYIKDVPLKDDPIEALADYQLHIRPQDPRTVGCCYERYDLIKQLGEACHADGYIHMKIPMCDMFAFDQDDFINYARRNNLPALKLDVDYVPDGTGQIRTRIQAFVETL